MSTTPLLDRDPPSTKRRRVEPDRDFGAAPFTVAPTTSRARAAANRAAAVAAQEKAALLSSHHPSGNGGASGNASATGGKEGPGNGKDKEHVPLFSLSTLPPASLQRYLSRYGLLEQHGTLSYHHAVFPVPPLPATLVPPLVGRQLIKPRPRYTGSAPDDASASSAAAGTRKRAWQDPKTPEFADLTAYDDPSVVTERLALKAKAHYDEKTLVKEGETLTNFVFALRMRAHTLRATPPG